jgi:peptidoglycan/LPS O-acetylase OafA/YrhL
LLFLDGLRGLAAFYVMVGHARWLLWEGYSDGYVHHPQDYSLAGRLGVYFFSLFKYGHEAVLFFFVLSGFVIHLRYARQLAPPGAAGVHFGWGAFVWRRARRLYPPLLAAILLSFCLDSWGQWHGLPIYFQNTPYPNINENIVPHLGWATLGGNLAFLMQTYVPAFGTDGPLWSLKYEWWFYMLYPLFWWLSKRSWMGATAVLTLLFGASFWPQLWPLRLLQQVFSAMLIWWLGVLLADVYAGRVRLARKVPLVGGPGLPMKSGGGPPPGGPPSAASVPRVLELAAGLPPSLAGSEARRHHRGSWAAVAAVATGLGVAVWALAAGGRSLAIGCGFAALLALGFELEGRGWPLRWLAKLKPLGDMSYTLYVTHFPVLVLLSGWLMSRHPEGVLPRHFGWVWAGMSLTLVLAYGLHFIVERPFLSRAAGTRKHAA